jgi:hypothetical protein
MNGRSISLGLLIIIVSAVGSGIAAYLHLEKRAQQEAATAVRVHQDSRLGVSHPEIKESLNGVRSQIRGVQSQTQAIQTQQRTMSIQLDQIQLLIERRHR